MLKYVDTQICTTEIPGELSLGISIYGCKRHCYNCHSDNVWNTSKDTGTELDKKELNRLIDINPYITCIIFFGGDWEPYELNDLAREVKFRGLKAALYSGESLANFFIYRLNTWFDYIKVGSYIDKVGGLQSKETNQRLYKRCSIIDEHTNEYMEYYDDITHILQRDVLNDT